MTVAKDMRILELTREIEEKQETINEFSDLIQAQSAELQRMAIIISGLKEERDINFVRWAKTGEIGNKPVCGEGHWENPLD